MVRVLLKAFDILELVASRNGLPISLTEISVELQINQATASNIINTMVTAGYLEHIGKKKGYRLGQSAYRLTNEVAYEQDLVNIAGPVMEKLTEQLNESCLLGVMRNHKRYIIHAVHSEQEIQVQIRSERNVYETASGRLLLAYLSEKDLDRFINQNGLPSQSIWEGTETKTDLLKALNYIKSKGISSTHSKSSHIRGFATPIFTKNVVVAGLSVFLPEFRCTPEHEVEIVANLQKASQLIGEKLDQ